MRMQMQDVNGVKLINDCYNSNPASLKCALDFLMQYGNGSHSRKIVVVGDMLALGRGAEKFHSDVGRRIASGGVDFLITVGRLARNIASGAYSAGMSRKAIYSCADSSRAAVLLRDLAAPEDIVLVKGSRAMQMENIIKCSTISFTR
jgi:UDP-N-acetylmuramoyl-tripeptide--D-alanyl-D-alanine ligase